MAVPNNVLQNVQTYQKSELAFLLNSFCAIRMTNKKFRDFNSMTANLGDTVTFDLAPRYLTYYGLPITNQPSQQRVQSLPCVQAANLSAAYTDQQFIFNVRDYMDRFGMAALKQLGTTIESDILKNVVSGMTYNDPNSPNFGNTIDTTSGPYRFYGDGQTQINSFTQLAQALANFRDYGADPTKTRCILPTTAVPSIVSSGLNQFAMNRNNEMSMSWMLGEFSNCEFYESNLLPTHVAGTVGQNGTTLTLVSTNDPTGNNVTQLTFSGATASDPDAIYEGDLMEFNDGVSGQPNMRYLTFIGQRPSQQPVQFRATQSVGATGGGQVTFNIYPPLVWAQNNNQNLNNALAAGMQITVMPSHKAGVIYSGDQFYLAMPQLPDQEPYSTVRFVDKDSGASIRHYWGTLFGQNVRSYVRDSIWGATMVAENSMRILFPA